ncbi:SUMF1/EgtB/PvdO family nonheme iron enzyme [Gracilinema caldarium]|uniref:PEGA domain protein n=1 Tax=Gracilinema caldarium (strain ATCC 51460 / DSM 7334 / H1) TaxID=744872 RepID=F8F2Q1_GRAC1|nr:SUMF1/EgtB/PvdO family nonheme iron enzyme [Gracilinema caldarium]AEJ19445.1 PEGA domain protein [Gracilinema caldarium DSM 7334]
MFGFIRKKTEILPEDRVTLKPIFGIEPGKYLTVLYALLIVGLLFFLLLYPGLTKRGSIYTIQTEPAGAAIRIDDVYQGTSPCTIFVPEGNHTISAVLPGFTAEQKTLDVGNRIFGSLFFPKHKQLFLKLSSDDPLNAILAGAQAYAAWTFAGEPSATYQVPLVLSEAMYRGAFQAVQSGHGDELLGILSASARFASTSVALRDLSRAHFFAHTSGLAPSNVTTLSALQDALAYINENPAAPAWLLSALPSTESKALASTDWYKKHTLASQTEWDSLKEKPALLGTRISIGPLQFREISIGDSTFYMAEQEVSQQAWDTFVAEHPEWAKEKKDALIAQGLVGSEYLESADNNAFPAGVVPGVSYYAAKAFCAWLTTKVPQGLKTGRTTDYQVRLPTELEWYSAASHFNNRNFTNIIGGLWEWCDTPFVPFPELKAPENFRNLLSSPEFVVKGGSWANKAQTIQAETRASLPPDSSSPFVGFRPVFARERFHE